MRCLLASIVDDSAHMLSHFFWETERNMFPNVSLLSWQRLFLFYFSVSLHPLPVLVVRIHIICTRTAQHVYQYVTLQKKEKK